MDSGIGLWYDQGVLIVVDILFDLNSVFCGKLFAVDEPMFEAN